ncbi:methylenetetrahydrofolate reductase C-terminal domain-containing protein [bacterium]|nr:methylenetetrahydrofolate reductase C-terminal domain-containing protein [bacterium]
MIKGEQKTIDEIEGMIADYRKILVVGCGTCVTICFVGGEKEVANLASSLRIKERVKKGDKIIEEAIVKRQCEREFIAEIAEKVRDADAVLSLACSIGAQAMAENFPDKPVLPGVNTTFLGLIEEPGKWSEVCSACGDCIIHLTGGICPVTRCAKSLFNGPCGGSADGKCEISPDVPCAWQQIYDRLAAQNRLHLMDSVFPVRNWRSFSAIGPRRIAREDLQVPKAEETT